MSYNYLQFFIWSYWDNIEGLLDKDFIVVVINMFKNLKYKIKQKGKIM